MSIKKYKFSLICFGLLLSSLLTAQEDKMDLLNVGLVMPKVGDIPTLSAGHLSKIETKLLSLLTNNGVSSQGGGGGIVMYPKVDIYDDQDVNTGMQNLKVVRLTLSLFVKQADDNAIFSSVSRELSGSGRTREQAVNNALANINPQDAKWATFMTQAKTKIGQYYEKMCPKIISQAEQLSQTGQMEQGISLLLNVPKETTCFKDVKAKSIELYKKYIAVRCAQQLQTAKAYIAVKDYKAALSIISKIDPESPCFSEATRTISSVEKDIDAELLRQWEFLKTAYKDAVELEKIRINAIRDIGVAYGGQSKTYNYLVLVR